MTVEPPRVDPLKKSEKDVEPRSFTELIAPVMEMRDCSKPQAESWINENGLEEAERQVRTRWTR